MKHFGFQRAVAIFVGILLVPAIPLALLSGDESAFGSVLLLAAAYAIYMVLFLRKWKEYKKTEAQSPKSPLMR